MSIFERYTCFVCAGFEDPMTKEHCFQPLRTEYIPDKHINQTIQQIYASAERSGKQVRIALIYNAHIVSEVETIGQEMITEIFQLCCHSNSRELENHLEKKKHIRVCLENIFNESYMGLLHVAFAAENIDMIHYLVSKGLLKYAIYFDKNGNSPLKYALTGARKTCDWSIVDWLVHGLAKIEEQSPDNLVNSMIRTGFTEQEIQDCDRRIKESLLFLAIDDRDIISADQLLAKRINIHIRNGQNSTPLHECCRILNPYLVGRLIAQGANFDAIDNDNNMPIHLVVGMVEKIKREYSSETYDDVPDSYDNQSFSTSIETLTPDRKAAVCEIINIFLEKYIHANDSEIYRHAEILLTFLNDDD